ncbi:hypothetical protein J4E85_006255 [Alternaria conjuncta]|uniref:uncharacterized protein n=1 Tax=Alternaria conjuncta TaxID=181017 RepID=UPI00221F5F71|nr:uncharacterized protein J4E85_006255 [Alternaria conjuncta]KAI4927743.1 hypothetical protein J4E85_006255 [Alternaria conjuncta]
MAATSTPPEKEPHISSQPITWTNWYKKINWLNTTLVILIPSYGLYLARSTTLTLPTFLWSIVYYATTAFGITGGYHRLWSHRCYSARLPLRLFLAFTGAGAIQGSIRWWSANHRAHHRWTDTMKDPYSVMRGLLFSHIGWMVLNNDPKVKGRTDISDLDSDPIVVFQHKHYGKLLLFTAWIFPAMVAGMGWGDWWGGFVYAGNAIAWYQYDPTKWLIWIMSKIPVFPLTYDLKTFRSNEIEKGRLQQQQKALDKKRSMLDWGVPLAQLPVISWDDFQTQASAKGAALVAIAGVIHDVSPFIADHPGGKTLIKSAVGKDATAVFNGGVYEHSNAAHNLLSTMRVGILRGGQEVEVWKTGGEKDTRDTKGLGVVRAGDQITRVAAPATAATAA